MSARPRLTPHQAEVFARIVRQSRANGFARSINIGSRQGCVHLVEKGYVRAEEVVGPRGGTTYHYYPIAEQPL